MHLGAALAIHVIFANLGEASKGVLDDFADIHVLFLLGIGELTHNPSFALKRIPKVDYLRGPRPAQVSRRLKTDIGWESLVTQCL